MNGVGDSIVLVAGGSFLNPTSRTLSPGAGRWLVYSSDPSLDTRGGLAYNFKQYNATYGVTPVAGSGNGFLYTLAPSTTASLVGTTGKVYDATLGATLTGANYATGGAIDGDTIVLTNPASGSYADKNVGSAKSVSATVAIASASNGAATVYGYSLASTTASGNIGEITPGTLTVTATGVDKVYDGTTSASVNLADNRIAGDVLATSYAIADFNNKNVGAAKPISVSGIGLVGADAGNYTFNATASASADITARALTVTAAGVDKVYDGATAATVNLADNRVAGDVLTTSYAAADFNNKNVGAAKPVSVSGIGLVGTDAGNYTFNTTAAASADITARALTVTATGVDKVYDGTTSASVNLADNRVAGDVLTSSYTSADFNNKNVGAAKPVSIGGIGLVGTDSGNYTFNTTASASADITARALTVTAAGVDRVYDGTTSASVNLADNRVAGDVLDDELRRRPTSTTRTSARRSR